MNFAQLCNDVLSGKEFVRRTDSKKEMIVPNFGQFSYVVSYKEGGKWNTTERKISESQLEEIFLKGFDGFESE